MTRLSSRTESTLGKETNSWYDSKPANANYELVGAKNVVRSIMMRRTKGLSETILGIRQLLMMPAISSKLRRQLASLKLNFIVGLG